MRGNTGRKWRGFTGGRARHVLRVRPEPVVKPGHEVPGPQSDLEVLVKQVCQGNDAAMRPLYDVLRPQLRRFVFRCLGGHVVGGNDLDDIVQGILISVWKSLPGFRGSSSARTWIYKIARRAVVDEVERRARTVTISLDPLEESAGYPAPLEIRDPAPDAGELVVSRLSGLEALRTLPFKYREAIVLVDGQGLSDHEAARVVGVPRQTFSTRLSRGRHALRGLLTPVEGSAG
jgi:RNA polymerase sigma-70 factor (ECF subfamily)